MDDGETEVNIQKYEKSLVATIDLEDEDDFLDGFVYGQTSKCRVCGEYGGGHTFSCATLDMYNNVLDLDPNEWKVI